MNKDQKVLGIIRHGVMWFWLGFLTACILVVNFGLGGWLATHSWIATVGLGVIIFVGATFEERVRYSKKIAKQH